MKKFKNNKGITLMSLVITIIILIILASVGTYSGIQIVNSSKLTAFTTELKIMQTKVNELYDKKEEIDVNTIGNDLTGVQTQVSKVFTASESGITEYTNYRYYDQQTIKEELKLEGVEGEFFVNVEKRSVISYDGLKYEGNTYYTLEQLPDSLYNIQYDENTFSGPIYFDVNVEIVKKGEWNVSISNIRYNGNINNWNVKYKLNNQEQYTNSDKLNFKLYEEGTYNFKVFNGNVESGLITKEIYIPDNKYIKNHVEDYYGHYVTNYNSPNDEGIIADSGEKWQIFMADDTNIYLIASSYITAEYTGTKNNVGFNYDESDTTKIWFTDILNQYNAGPNITDIPTILSKLNKQSKYHKWINNQDNQRKNYANEKAVAAMLDIDLWSGYNNTTYAQYAIGGPTLEMFCESFNESHLAYSIKAKEEYDTGYKIQKNDENDVNFIGLYSHSSTPINDYVDKMLFYNTYWVASPSAAYFGHIITPYDGGINYNSYKNKIGFRPLVCLKSDILLVLNEDHETYSILY